MMVRVKVGFVRSLEDELGEYQIFLFAWRNRANAQPSPRASSSTSTRRTTTAGACARTTRTTAVSSPSAASSPGRSKCARGLCQKARAAHAHMLHLDPPSRCVCSFDTCTCQPCTLPWPGGRRVLVRMPAGRSCCRPVNGHSLGILFGCMVVAFEGGVGVGGCGLGVGAQGAKGAQWVQACLPKRGSSARQAVNREDALRAHVKKTHATMRS
jgi:hypothetical protein